jgi:transposase
MSDWTFFSNHAHALFVLSTYENITVRELAVKVGVTERFAHKVISDLFEEGYVLIEKVGRQNHYKVNFKKKLRHSVESHISTGDLIDLISK